MESGARFVLVLVCAISAGALLCPNNRALAQASDLAGNYKLDAAASDDVSKAIDGVAAKNWFIEDKIREELTCTNPLYERLVISFTDSSVSIQPDNNEAIKTTLDGTPVEWVRKDCEGEDEEVEVSTTGNSARLERTFAARGKRINTYSLGTDGNTLVLDVKVTSFLLPEPLIYRLIYRRVM